MTRFDQREPKRKHYVSRAPVTNIAPHTAVGTDSIKPCPPYEIILLHRTHGLLQLDGSSYAVPSFRLHLISVPSRAECLQVTSCRASSVSGIKAGTTSKTFFKLMALSFCPKERGAAFVGSITPKTPVSKLNRAFVRKPPAAIASESMRVACEPFAKPQVAGLRHR